MRHAEKNIGIYKNYVSYDLKELFNFCIISGVYPNVFKVAQITPIYKKGSFHIISNYRPVFLMRFFSAKFLKILYITVFKVSVKHQNFLSKIISVSEKKTEKQSWQL